MLFDRLLSKRERCCDLKQGVKILATLARLKQFPEIVQVGVLGKVVGDCSFSACSDCVNEGPERGGDPGPHLIIVGHTLDPQTRSAHLRGVGHKGTDQCPWHAVISRHSATCVRVCACVWANQQPQVREHLVCVRDPRRGMGTHLQTAERVAVVPWLEQRLRLSPGLKKNEPSPFAQLALSHAGVDLPCMPEMSAVALLVKDERS